MPPRLFVASDLVKNGFAALDEAQAKYLTRVLRLGRGDRVRVFNGRDGEWAAELDTVEGRTVLLKALAPLRDQATTPDLVLMFAPLKKARTDFVVEKATELGACLIQPVITERTQAARVRAERLQKVALEAAEQTERLDLPLVRPAAALHAALDALEAERPVFFCDEGGAGEGTPWTGPGARAAPAIAAFRACRVRSGAILVGPEGGFSQGEREMLHARDGVTAISLGPRILRAETAAVAALALWEATLGDWDQ